MAVPARPGGLTASSTTSGSVPRICREFRGETETRGLWIRGSSRPLERHGASAMPISNGKATGPSRGNGTAAERFDVIIVGARCAGSSLAVILARAGMKVAVIEQATFPKMTLSSHLMEADGLDFLRRIGVLDAVRQTGARFMKQIDMRL